MKILTNEDKQYLLSVSAYVMPDNPTMQGWSAKSIKKHYYEPSLMLFSWLQATQQEVNVNTSLFQDELAKIKNGQTIVKKAEQDKNGNDIAATYETKVDAKTKYDKLDIKKQNNMSAGKNITIDGTTINSSALNNEEVNDLILSKKYETISNVDKKLTHKADLVNGQVPASQLPSFVDGLDTFPTFSDFPLVGNANKIYVAQDTNLSYRWNGIGYTEISPSIALGETSSTAYAGNKGKANRDDIDLLKVVKLNKSNEQSHIYATDYAGNQTTIRYQKDQALGNSIAMRNTNGTLTIANANNNNEATTKEYVDTKLNSKQPTLISGTSIKTINNESLLGSGNIAISGGSTVVANPSDEPTQDLDKLKVANVTYSVTPRESEYKVECNHELEITGYTGEESGKAIPTETFVKVDKIQGQTKRASENLINLPDKDTTINGVNIIFNKGSITFNGKATAGTVITIFNYNLPSGQYSLAFRSVGTSSTFMEINVSNENTNYFMQIKTSVEKAFISKTTDSKIKKMYAYFGQGTEFHNYTIYLSLLKGSYNESTMPPFQPYNPNLIHSFASKIVSTGKNLCNSSSWRLGYSIQLNTTIVDFCSLMDYQPIAPNTPIQVNAKGTFNSIQLLEYDKNKTFIKLTDAINTKDVSTTSQTYFYRLQVWQKGGVTNIPTETMVNYGTQALPYEDFKSNEYLIDRDLKAFDTIDVVNETATIQSSDVIIFDGSEDETWEANGGTQNGKIRYINRSYKTQLSGHNVNLRSNYVDKSADKTWLNEDGVSIDGAGLQVYVDSIQDNSVVLFKEWLRKNPLQVVYKLATPKTYQLSRPRGYVVYKGGLQKQEVIYSDRYSAYSLPYIVSKVYTLSLTSQVKASMEAIAENKDKIIDLNENKQNKLVAGTGIEIRGNTINNTSYNEVIYEGNMSGANSPTDNPTIFEKVKKAKNLMVSLVIQGDGVPAQVAFTTMIERGTYNQIATHDNAMENLYASQLIWSSANKLSFFVNVGQRNLATQKKVELNLNHIRWLKIVAIY